MHVPTALWLAIAIVVAVGFALRIFFSASERASEQRRETLKSKRMSQQPWDDDSADGRAHR